MKSAIAPEHLSLLPANIYPTKYLIDPVSRGVPQSRICWNGTDFMENFQKKKDKNMLTTQFPHLKIKTELNQNCLKT